MMHTFRFGRLTGILFLLAIGSYAYGLQLVSSAGEAIRLGARPEFFRTSIAGGSLLILLNTCCVTAIAVLVYPAIQSRYPIRAIGYLVCRVIEGVLLLAGLLLQLIPIAGALPQQGAAVYTEISSYAYQFAMILLACGSIPFCCSLHRIGVSAVFWAYWGVAGYSLLAIGAVAACLGYPWDVYAAMPGGLFELMLALRLIWGEGVGRRISSDGPCVPASGSGSRV